MKSDSKESDEARKVEVAGKLSPSNRERIREKRCVGGQMPIVVEQMGTKPCPMGYLLRLGYALYTRIQTII